jgi:hypothetical protein
VTGSGVEPGRGDPPEPVNGVATGMLGRGAVPTGARPDCGLWLDEPTGAAWALAPAVTALAAPLPPALAAAASSAADPPALLAAGVDGGNCNGVIAPRAEVRIGLAGFEPPRGAMAAPPPLGFAGCHGRLMPCSDSSVAGAAVNDSQSFVVPWIAVLKAGSVPSKAPPAPPAEVSFG